MIDVHNLSKTYKVSRRSSGMRAAIKQFIRPSFDEIHAISDLSFHIDPGEIVGYMGPNGAGKSTTIKIMSGILTPDSGTCLIDGRTPWVERKSHVSRIGVVFGQRSQLWWDTPVIDSFELLKEIYRVSDTAYRKQFQLLVETLNLSELLNTPVRQLSLGQRMRCEVAASLIHQPKILFLDEPTIGLDAVSKLAIREFIQTINREKAVTVILTTHDTSDLEALCKRVMLIGKGQILYDGDFDLLKKTHAPERYIEVKANYDMEVGQLQRILDSYPSSHAKLLSFNQNEFTLELNPEQISVGQLITHIGSQIDIEDLEVKAVPVDEMVARLYKVHQL